MCTVWLFSQGVNLFALKFYLDGSSFINHFWYQKTRDSGLPNGEDHIPLRSWFWHNTRVWRTDGRTDRQRGTGRFAVAYTALNYSVRLPFWWSRVLSWLCSSVCLCVCVRLFVCRPTAWSTPPTMNNMLRSSNLCIVRYTSGIELRRILQPTLPYSFVQHYTSAPVTTRRNRMKICGFLMRHIYLT